MSGLPDKNYDLLPCFWFSFQNHYQVLELKRNCDTLAINKSFRLLSLKWHPDNWIHGTLDEKKLSNEMFLRITEAMQVLLTDRESFDTNYPNANFVSGDSFDFPSLQSTSANFDDNVVDVDDDDYARKSAAMMRFFNYYVECLHQQYKQDHSMVRGFISMRIPATIHLLRFHHPTIKTSDTVMSSWLCLALCNPKGLNLVLRGPDGGNKDALFSAIYILFSNDRTT